MKDAFEVTKEKYGVPEKVDGLQLTFSFGIGRCRCRFQSILKSPQMNLKIWMITSTVSNGIVILTIRKRSLIRRAYERKIELEFSRPGKPTDNAFIESFNGSLRDECLNVNWFLSLEDAQQKLDVWKEDYNSYRPHSSLGNLTPNEFIENSQKIQISLL